MWLTVVVAVTILGLHLVRTSTWLFSVWPGNEEEVQFVWQSALADAAAFLDEQPASPTAIGGWSPESMDGPTMELALQRDDLQLRFFQPQRALLVPGDGSLQQPARLLLPTILPLHPLFADELARWGATFASHGRFVEYQLGGRPAPSPQLPASVSFGGELRFLGYTLDVSCQDGYPLPCQVITYWEVLQPTGEPRRIFLHALDEQGELLATGDDLGAPAEFWQPGDLLLQRHEINPGETGFAALQLGLYHPETEQRQLTATGDDGLLLPAPVTD